MSIKLLVVDDSAFMRKIISDIVAEIDGLEVVGIGRNGVDALEAIPRFKPDIITLDIEMPKLNGLDTLKIIKRDYHIPVIMLSSLTGTDVTIEALQIGAEDFIEKPKDLQSNLDDFKRELELKVRSVVNKPKFIKKPVKKLEKKRSLDIPKSQLKPNNLTSLEGIVIAASTGGPKALSSIISKLPSTMNLPIFIVQHMPKGFTSSFASRLNSESSVRVVEARDNMAVENGVVYIAPGDYHMYIENKKIKLDGEKAKLHGVRPAADYLFMSASKVYKDKLLGIVLTGMGKDGSMGMKKIKKYGGYTIAQDEESCVVYGMPRYAIENKVVDDIMSLDSISKTINRITR